MHNNSAFYPLAIFHNPHSNDDELWIVICMAE